MNRLSITQTLKNKHGGARKGAGRPKTKEETKVMRVPVSLVPKVEKLIRNHKLKTQDNNH